MSLLSTAQKFLMFFLAANGEVSDERKNSVQSSLSSNSLASNKPLQLDVDPNEDFSLTVRASLCKEHKEQGKIDGMEVGIR